VIIASSEFALKSAPVRRTLEQRLLDDIRTALGRGGISGLRPEKHAGRIAIRGVQDAQTVAKICASIFGVVYAAHGFVVSASKDEILQTAARVASDRLESGQTFAIRAHRSGPTAVSRREIEVDGGAKVLAQLKQRDISVRLNHPDVTIYVDLADDRAYVYSDVIPGPGGLPLSAQWKMLAIQDSGPLSILAAYSMMRRGCVTELFIPVSEQIALYNREHQFDLARKLRRFVTRAEYKAHVFELDEALNSASSQNHARTLVGEAALRFARTKKFRGLIFSDVEGDLEAIRNQVAGESVPPVLLYPLIGFSSEDLNQLSTEAGVPIDEYRGAREASTVEVTTGSPSQAQSDLTVYVSQVLL
jgi:adenylyl- and sulfurtransferase ThiI